MALLQHAGRGEIRPSLNLGWPAERRPHPVAAKREEGKTKTRLLVDPARGPAVTQIFTWRHDGQPAYKTIAERLNTDLDRYPPPQPNRSDLARHSWTVSAVREILIEATQGHFTSPFMPPPRRQPPRHRCRRRGRPHQR